MVYECTKELMELLREDDDVISCFLCTGGKWRISFSPFKKYLKKTEFWDELLEPKPKAPYIYLTGRVLVFIYKDRVFRRISLAEVRALMELLAGKCRELGVKKLLLPISTFLVEGVSVSNVIAALLTADTEGVDIYYF